MTSILLFEFDKKFTFSKDLVGIHDFVAFRYTPASLFSLILVIFLLQFEIHLQLLGLVLISLT